MNLSVDRLVKKYEKVTLSERDAFLLKFNLADAQVYTSPSPKQAKIISELSKIFARARSAHLEDLKQHFSRILFNFHEQPYALNDRNHQLFCYSASIGIEIAANLIRLQLCRDNKNIALIHPTFDNLFHITKRHNLSPLPISELDLKSKTLLQQKFSDSLCAIFLTLPNNPTGFDLDEVEFIALCDFCKNQNILLIIDCCYRYYKQHTFDQYRILIESDVDFILIEDTGKLFPLLDIKLGVLCCNQRVFPLVNNIHSDFLLEVSKFTLAVVSEMFEHHDEAEKQRNRDIIKMNREHLISELAPFEIVPIKGENINVQLMELPRNASSDVLEWYFAQHGVGIISASKLFWASKSEGKSMIRVALSREPSYFWEALKILSNALRASENEHQ